MIRHEAAQKLAESILAPLLPEFQRLGSTTELVASLIVKSVQEDELKQEIERLEAACST